MAKKKLKKRRRKISVGSPKKHASQAKLKGLSKTPSLRRRRIRAGLSIAQVASRAGLSFATIWRIEEGEQAPTKATKDRIRRAISGKN